MIRRWGSGGSGRRPPRTEIEKRGKYIPRSTSIVSATALTVAPIRTPPAHAPDASPAHHGTVPPHDAERTATGTSLMPAGTQAPDPNADSTHQDNYHRAQADDRTNNIE